jgi:hypothetical protein
MCGGPRGGERSSACATGRFTCGDDIQVRYKNNMMRIICTFLSRHGYRCHRLFSSLSIVYLPSFPLFESHGRDYSLVLVTAHRATANEKSNLLVRHVMPTFLSINVFRFGDSTATLPQLPLAHPMILIIRLFA